MPRTKISEFSATAASNTDIDSINIAENCPPSGINDAIRELMAQLKDFQTGAVGDSFNGPVGTSTAAAGAFTTLSASSTVTLSGGTANGVAYLNGSKVVTSGSALTFDGTGFQLSTSTGGNFYLNSTTTGTSNQIVSLLNNGNAYGNLNYKAFDHIWSYGASEQMRLTSTGLGIGTSSPAAKLHVAGENAIIDRSGGDPYLAFYTSGSATNVNVYGGSSTGFRVFTGGSERMRLDSSGNLGLGVTPSAWGLGKAIQIAGSTGFLGFTGVNGNIVTNTYYDGSNYRYIANGAAFLYEQSVGHKWSIAASGTAGTAITFTQALTLDASGNLQLGTTSNIGTSKVSIYSSDLATAYNGISVKNGTNSTGGYFAAFYNYLGNLAGSISQSSATTVLYNVSSDYRLKNITGPITTSGAYIDSLNPVEGTWKADGSTFVGLIAHEVQEASRTQVATGTKDGAEMQAMDYSNSELIANLIAEVKSLRQRVATLEAK